MAGKVYRGRSTRSRRATDVARAENRGQSPTSDRQRRAQRGEVLEGRGVAEHEALGPVAAHPAQGGDVAVVGRPSATTRSPRSWARSTRALQMV